MSDEIRIDLKSDSSEAEKARKKLAEVESQVKELKSSFEQGNVATARYNQELKSLERQADRARSALEKVKPARLGGADRAGAISRAGLLGANTLQDVIQGGPASGINNILGAANDKGIKALAGEFIGAAGGAKFLAGALGTVAVAAGAAFLTIDQGLKTNKLGWSDLGSVINEMSGGAIASTGRVWGETLGEIRDSIAGVVGSVAEVTIGWNSSAEAVRAHKDEIDRATTALEAYGKAQKDLSGVKSDAQEEAAKGGKAFANEAADLGGEKGLQGVIDALARSEAGADADVKHKVTRRRRDKEGNEVESEEEVTGQQIRAEAITQDFANAHGGDKASQDALRKRLGAAGFDANNLGGREAADKRTAEDDDDAIASDDAARARKKERRKEAQKKQDDADAEFATLDDRDIASEDAARQRAKDRKKEKAKAAHDKAEKATAGTDLGGRIDDALTRATLQSGGQAGVASKKVAEQLSLELQGKGLTKKEADAEAQDRVAKHAADLGDKVNADARKPGDKDKDQLDAPSRIASADFARSVEGAGSDEAKMLKTSEDMLTKLTDLVRLAQQGPRLGP